MITPLLFLVACLSTEDIDQDGYAAPEDCNDYDSSINPGANELFYDADGIDQNCDGDADGVEPCKNIDTDGWTDLLETDDPEGDNDGYVFDIRSHQYQVLDRGSQNERLLFRTTSWIRFDRSNDTFQIDMGFNNNSVGFNLSYDSVYPDPSPVQLWGSFNNWSGPAENTDGIVFACPREEVDPAATDIVLGVQMSALDVFVQGWVNAFVQTGWWVHEPENDYVDDAPDDVRTDYGVACLDEAPHLKTTGPTVDDGEGGDGDGVWEAGETLDLYVTAEARCAATSGGLRVGLVTGTGNQATVEFVTSSVPLNGGEAMVIGQEATTDTPLQVHLASDTLTGADVLSLKLVFFDETSDISHPLDSYAVILDVSANSR